MIVIVDYGLGNLTSIANMFRKFGGQVVISANHHEIEAAEKIILPGVGHFKTGMNNLVQTGLKNLLDRIVLVEKRPILGICLGAQLMTRHSEEGNTDGLGWVDANTVRFRSEEIDGLKIPHMGWREISIAKTNKILSGLPNDPRFYFVHTFHFEFENEEQVSATSLYGYSFCCSFNKENIYGTQFHPEKSHKFGMKVLENFSQL